MTERAGFWRCLRCNKSFAEGYQKIMGPSCHYCFRAPIEWIDWIDNTELAEFDVEIKEWNELMEKVQKRINELYPM